MADAAAAAAQRRQRIINHVNRDHQAALSHYLQHWVKVPVSAASSSLALTDVSLDRMLIRTSDREEHVVPFDPPLTGWDEMRPRLVSMDADARAALGIADPVDGIVITEYKPPRGVHAVVVAGILFYFTSWVKMDSIVPDSTPWHILETVFPGGPSMFLWLTKVIFWPVIAIHTAEAIAFDLTRLVPNGVPRFSALWWKWVATCWVEGVTCWLRIDALIATKKAQKAEKQH